MSTLSADLEQAVRAIVRDEIAKAGGVTKPHPVVTASAFCGFPSGKKVCRKPGGHEGRHKYEEPSVNPSAGHVPVVRNWERVNDVWVKVPGYLKRTHFVVGNTCRVQGERGLWTIVSIERHKYEEKINVEVRGDRTGHSRTFPVERIIYKRPKKVS